MNTLRRLLLGIALASLAVTAWAQQRPTGPKVALVIGNSSYPAGALENPKNDATEMHAAFRRLGFDSELRLNATKADLNAAFRRFSNKADRAEVAVLFYAGHGVQVSGSNYLVPIDASPQTERDVKREMVRLDDIIDDMGGAKIKMVFFDACRDNPLSRSFSRSGARGMAPPVETSGTLISFATKHGTTASDGSSKHSPYTEALLEELRNPSGVEIESMLRRVQQTVKKSTRGQQEPWRYGSLDGEFYFAGARPASSAATAPAPAQETRPTQQVIQTVDPAAIDLSFWDSIKNSSNAADFRAYLEQFPNGRFVALARNRLQPPPTTAPPAAPASPAPPVQLAFAQPGTAAIQSTASRSGLGSPASVLSAVLGQVSSNYPSKPLRLVVPFAPGGATDIFARSLASKASESAGQPFIVDNRPGAGGVIGAEFVAKAAPDGYSLLIASSSLAAAPSIYARLPFDLGRDFAAVAMVGFSPLVLVAHPSGPANVAALVASAKSNPGKISYASFGNGSSAHFLGVLLKSATRTDLLHVPYKGTAPALTDLLAGRVDVMFAPWIAAAPHVQAGRLRAVAQSSEARSAQVGNVPTFAEVGLPEVEYLAWSGIFAPAGTPREVINKANRLFVGALNTTDTQSRLQQAGIDAWAGTPEATSAYLLADIEKHRRIAQAAGIKPE